MTFFVVRGEDGKFLTNRKPTGNHYPKVYQARSGWSDDLEQAKVFTTKGAATRSGNDNGEHNFEVVEVEVKIKNE